MHRHDSNEGWRGTACCAPTRKIRDNIPIFSCDRIELWVAGIARFSIDFHLIQLSELIIPCRQLGYNCPAGATQKSVTPEPLSAGSLICCYQSFPVTTQS
jgi:hypothetical protein